MLKGQSNPVLDGIVKMQFVIFILLYKSRFFLIDYHSNLVDGGFLLTNEHHPHSHMAPTH